MNQFYSSYISDGVATLSESESQHLRVLRMLEGDDVLVVDGVGHQYRGELTKLHRKASEVTIKATIRSVDDPPLLDIAIAPTKSNDRMEWFFGKSYGDRRTQHLSIYQLSFGAKGDQASANGENHPQCDETEPTIMVASVTSHD